MKLENRQKLASLYLGSPRRLCWAEPGRQTGSAGTTPLFLFLCGQTGRGGQEVVGLLLLHPSVLLHPPPECELLLFHHQPEWCRRGISCSTISCEPIQGAAEIPGTRKVKQDVTVTNNPPELPPPIQKQMDQVTSLSKLSLQEEDNCTLKSTSRCPISALTLHLASSYVQERRNKASCGDSSKPAQRGTFVRGYARDSRLPSRVT